MLIKKSQQAAHHKEVMKYADTPGLCRNNWERLNSETPSGSPVLTLSYGGTKVSASSDGSIMHAQPVIHDEEGNEIQAGLALDDLKKFPVGVTTPGCCRGAVPANKTVDGVVIPCGAVLIIGAGGAGKTPLAHALAMFGRDSFELVPAGEPMAGYMSDEFGIACEFASALVKSPDVVFDSVKDRLSEGSNAMKSGLSRQALVALSQWSARACEVGASVYIPVNPSVPDPDVVSLLVEASNSNATCTITLESHSDTKSVWQVFRRSGEGLPRSKGRIELSFDKEGLPIVHGLDKPTQPQSDNHAETRSVVVQTQALSDAIRRAITPQ